MVRGEHQVKPAHIVHRAFNVMVCAVRSPIDTPEGIKEVGGGPHWQCGHGCGSTTIHDRGVIRAVAPTIAPAIATTTLTATFTTPLAASEASTFATSVAFTATFSTAVPFTTTFAAKFTTSPATATAATAAVLLLVIRAFTRHLFVFDAGRQGVGQTRRLTPRRIMVPGVM